jgi:hypothetical protein
VTRSDPPPGRVAAHWRPLSLNLKCHVIDALTSSLGPQHSFKFAPKRVPARAVVLSPGPAAVVRAAEPETPSHRPGQGDCNSAATLSLREAQLRSRPHRPGSLSRAAADSEPASRSTYAR